MIIKLHEFSEKPWIVLILYCLVFSSSGIVYDRSKATGTTIDALIRVLKSLESSTAQLVDRLFRSEAGKLVATLIRIFGTIHIDLAEDIVQETLITASHYWKITTFRIIRQPGSPRSPKEQHLMNESEDYP